MSEHEQSESQTQKTETQSESRYKKVKAFVIRQTGIVQEYIREVKRDYVEHKADERGYPGNYIRSYLSEQWCNRAEYWRAFRVRWSAERGMLVATVVIAAATIVQAIVARYQWTAITEQNAEFVKSNKLIERQVGEMSRQTAAMINQTEEMIKSNEALVEQTTAAKEQVRQSKIAIQETRLDRRAWLGITKPKIFELVGGKPVKCHVDIHNSGNTPGSIVAFKFRIVDITRGVSIDYDVVRELTKTSPDILPPVQMVVAPGQSVTLPILGDTFDEDTVKKFKGAVGVADGGLDLYLLGRIFYDDGMGERRDSQCVLKRVEDAPEGRNLVTEHQYNYMD